VFEAESDSDAMGLPAISLAPAHHQSGHIAVSETLASGPLGKRNPFGLELGSHFVYVFGFHVGSCDRSRLICDLIL
jgi:hypothetical protein